MDQHQNIEDFEPGEEVEVFVNDEWAPGIIDDIHSYTILNPRTRRQMEIMPGDIRNLTTQVRGPNGNLLVDSEIEFRENGIWVPGILISKNYRVEMQDFYGGIEIVGHSNIIPQAPRVEQQRAPQPQAAAPGLAFEIHNAFADLDLPKFMNVIRRENNSASNFKDSNNILEPVVSYINGPDTSLSQEQKTRYTRNIRDTIRQNVNTYITDHPELKADTLEVIQFVLSQDPNYKDLYIETFENECMGGYSTGNRQSCIKGMFERIYMANKGTIEGLCFEELQGTSAAATASAAASRANACKPVYLELYSAFTPGADIDVNDIFQKWYNQFSYDAIPEETNPLRNLSVNSRKQHFRDFVRQDEAISPRIWNNPEFQRKLEQSIQANNIIFETLSLDAGLGKRRRKRRTVKKKKKHRKATIKRLKRKTRGRY
jgi:hypothetical protein